MTGHLEDFVWAINPLHSSKAGSGCEVKPGWKGQAVLSICVFVPGGTEGHLHASLVTMVCSFHLGVQLLCGGCLPEQNCRDDTSTSQWREGAGEQFQQMTQERKRFLSWSASGHHQQWSSSYTTSSFHFPGVSRGGCSQPGRSVFYEMDCSVCAFTAWSISCSAPSPFHGSAAGGWRNPHLEILLQKQISP